MKSEAENSDDPIRFVPVVFDAPIISPTPVASVARIICFGTR